MEKRSDALERMDRNECLKSIASSFGVCESIVSDWKEKNINAIKSFCIKLDDKDALDFRSTLKKPKFEKLDDGLLLWLNQERSKGKPINGPILKEKAVQLHQKMNGDDDFKASEVWLRLGIHMLTISGEKLSADFEAATKFKGKFEYLTNEKDLCDEQAITWMKLVCTLDCFQKKTLASTKEAATPGYKKVKTEWHCLYAAMLQELINLIWW